MKILQMLKIIVPAVSLVLVAGAASAQSDKPAEGAGMATSTCNEKVTNRLKNEYGIDWDGTEEKDAYAVKMGREQMQTGYNYWIRPEGCTDGYLVLDVASSCAIRNVYTTGSCQVAGVPNWD